MLSGVLKKVAFIMLVVVVYQNWGKIEHVFNPDPVTAAAAQKQQHVVLYATDWCGYCKQTRRFLDSKGISYKEYDIEAARRSGPQWTRDPLINVLCCVVLQTSMTRSLPYKPVA